MVVMGGTGILLYVFSPSMMAMLSPDEAIRQAGVEVLRRTFLCGVNRRFRCADGNGRHFGAILHELPQHVVCSSSLGRFPDTQTGVERGMDSHGDETLFSWGDIPHQAKAGHCIPLRSRSMLPSRRCDRLSDLRVQDKVMVSMGRHLSYLDAFMVKVVFWG